MIALGIDVSTKKVAVAGITEAGDLHTHAVHVPLGQVGARRLCLIRSALASSLSAARWQDACAVVVEVAWPGFVLLAATAVVMEATQASLPGAIVMEVQPASWKRETVGRGSAPKGECMAYARVRGYEGEDQDLADALCMAAAAWHRWQKSTKEAA